MYFLMSRRAALLLWTLVFVSALLVVLVSHNARCSFVRLQSLLDATASFDVEWGRLLIEKSSSSSYSRLESVARDRLQMIIPEGDQLVTLKEEAR